ncbi:MAG: MBL fold metallo-hydrolase [Chloroflexota bacterium]
MYLKQFYVPSLGHYSYLIGADEANVAFVVDPKRDIQDYLDAAREQHPRITHIFETHLHNDYVSGARELAAVTGARVHSSAIADSGFDRVPVREGDEFRFGELLVRVMETPGHTPEHVSYTVADSSRSNVPALMLTGGDLLVGSVGRPDLLGEELGRELAPKLYDSLHQKILREPDHVMVLPTHGAGSSCGSNISRTRTSTIGYERLTNPALQRKTKEDFVAFVLSGQPAIPAYYKRMRPTNQQGPGVLGTLPEPRSMEPGAVEQALAGGSALIDARQPAAFGGAYIAGSYNVGLGSSFSTWVGSTVPPGRPIVLVLDHPTDLGEAVNQLIRIGYEDVQGYLAGGIEAWLAEGRPVEHVPQISVHELHQALSRNGAAPRVLDVRSTTEWQAGHIESAMHIPGGDLGARIGEVPTDKRLAIICGSGYRSSVASGILRRHHVDDVVNVLGGMTAWQRAGYPTSKNGGN